MNCQRPTKNGAQCKRFVNEKTNGQYLCKQHRASPSCSKYNHNVAEKTCRLNDIEVLYRNEIEENHLDAYRSALSNLFMNED